MRRAATDKSCLLTDVWLLGILRNMKRTTIWLTAPQQKKLAAASKKTGIPVSELIRRYIDAGLQKEKP
jgi:hypothetical protein